MKTRTVSICVLLFAFVLIFSNAKTLVAAKPTVMEMYDAKSFVATKFLGIADTERSVPIIEVLRNHESVARNSRAGLPLKVGSQMFSSGFCVHANSQLAVHLPCPAERFEAVIGVDSNGETRGGRGSVRFAVAVDGRNLFQTGIVTEVTPPQPISIDLNGTKTFELLVDDGGDGIGWDQADWADAKVTLRDGTEIWLGDVPFAPSEKMTTEPLFSFRYGDANSKDFLDNWKLQRSSRELDDLRTEYTLTYTDPKTRLEAKIVGVAYSDFPVVEWTLYFTNHGTDTPILSNIQAIDAVFPLASESRCVLNYNKGDYCSPDSYEPLQKSLQPNELMQIANVGGRPTNFAFPYFNISTGDNRGLVYVLSWSGQWNADFLCDARGLTLRGRQEATHFKLLPGETVRQPMVVVQFWQGDVNHAQNIWRSWMVAHNIPRVNGELPKTPMISGQNLHLYGSNPYDMTKGTTENQVEGIGAYSQLGFNLDYWWIDAGWYKTLTANWAETGTWEVNTERFPQGLLPVTKYGRERGIKTILWFEPERVAAGMWLANEHPEWIHGGKDGGLVRMSDPVVVDWIIEKIDSLITENGVDLYRQDFNIDPLGYWRSNDAVDRQGITEIRHIEGYFRFWDELRKRHPEMLIDSCASGGRRNDLETLRRALPLLRTDYVVEPISSQCHSFALPVWIPFFGTGQLPGATTYYLRSAFAPSMYLAFDLRDKSYTYEREKHDIELWREFGKFYLSDYYPLTPYSLSPEDWLGWQFHDENSDSGTVQMFRRDKCRYEAGIVPLFGLNDKTVYRVRNLDDASDVVEKNGAELKTEGIRIVMSGRPAAAAYIYEPKQ